MRVSIGDYSTSPVGENECAEWMSDKFKRGYELLQIIAMSDTRFLVFMILKDVK